MRIESKPNSFFNKNPYISSLLLIFTLKNSLLPFRGFASYQKEFVFGISPFKKLLEEIKSSNIPYEKFTFSKTIVLNSP